MAKSRLLKYFASIKTITINALLNIGNGVTGLTVYVNMTAEKTATFYATQTRANTDFQ